jgi:hypothetical protein
MKTLVLLLASIILCLVNVFSAAMTSPKAYDSFRSDLVEPIVGYYYNGCPDMTVCESAMASLPVHLSILLGFSVLAILFTLVVYGYLAILRRRAEQWDKAKLMLKAAAGLQIAKTILTVGGAATGLISISALASLLFPITALALILCIPASFLASRFGGKA